MTTIANIILKLIAICGFASVVGLALFILVVLGVFCFFGVKEAIENIKIKNKNRK